MSGIQIAFSVDLAMCHLFQCPTVAELVMVLEGHTLSTSEGKHLSKIVPVSRDKEHPLSFSQRRLWDWQQLAGESAT
jgi:hypothetical protein